MPRTRKLPGSRPDRIDEDLARRWWPYCEAWARAMERRHGRDFGSAANLGLWRACAAYQGWGDFRRLLRRCLLRAASGVFRRAAVAQRRAPTRPIDLEGEPPDPRTDPTEARDLWQARGRRLGARRRAVVEALYWHGLSYSEAAARLGLARGTIGNDHHAALEILGSEPARPDRPDPTEVP